jgi:hypothetical protein
MDIKSGMKIKKQAYSTPLVNLVDSHISNKTNVLTKKTKTLVNKILTRVFNWAIGLN